MYIGITGHQDIPDQALSFIKKGIEKKLNQFDEDLIGLSSLAKGADQIFAEKILKQGSNLYAIIPCKNYDQTFTDQKSLEKFTILFKNAIKVEQLEYDNPSENAFLAAGQRIVELSDILLAVWDGKKVKGKGGTADIVNYAMEKKIKVIIIWPQGVSR
jgi:hypothetical protein